MRLILTTNSIMLALILTLTLSAVSITDGAGITAFPDLAHIGKTNDRIAFVGFKQNTTNELFAVNSECG